MVGLAFILACGLGSFPGEGLAIHCGKVLSMDSLKGEFHSIPEALDPNKVKSLSTFGANDQTMRMLYQDYLGTYVFHCHILPHEDAGMMQVITIVENTDSSWIIAAEGFKSDSAIAKSFSD